MKKSRPQEQEPWISQEVLELSNERSRVEKAKQDDPSLKPKYNFLNREIKRKTRGCKDKWLQDLCSEVENAHQAAKSKEVYATIKEITRTVKSKTGTILTEQSDVKERWKENYQELYNEHNPTNEIAANILPINSSNDPEPKILNEEIESAIKKLSEEKAPGFDSVSSEEIKAVGGAGVNIFHYLCNQIWETINNNNHNNPDIQKKKDKLDCGNYRGISLLFYAGKVMAIILQRRILKKTEEILSKPKHDSGQGELQQTKYPHWDK